MEGDKVVSMYVVSFEREGGKMTTIPKKPDEELWYYHIVRNFVLPQDDDLAAQLLALLSNLGIGPEKKKRAPAVTVALKKNEVEKVQPSRGRNVGGEKKVTCRSSDFWCDYVMVSDSLEDLAPAVVRRPKPEPKDTSDIPPSNPDDHIDLESSPERLLRKKAGKRKQSDVDAEGQSAKKVQKKKITRRGNLDAFTANPLLEKPDSSVHREPSSVVTEELPHPPPHDFVADPLKNTDIPENEARETAGAENLGETAGAEILGTNIPVEAGKLTSLEVADGAGKIVEETHVTTSLSMASGSMPENIEKVTIEDQGSFSDADKILQSAQMKLWGIIIIEVTRRRMLPRFMSLSGI
ncbi:hypothetical protein Hanom_Chr03g00205551 [Helianthus anomalus]